MSKLSPASKVKAISQSCNETLSPASKSSLSQKLSNEAENPLVGIHQNVSKKRDKTSNCVRHLVLNKLATSAGCAEKVKTTYRNLNWTSLQYHHCSPVNHVIKRIKIAQNALLKCANLRE